MLRGEHDDHDVGDAGDGERDEGGVDDRDQEDTDEAERKRMWTNLLGCGAASTAPARAATMGRAAVSTSLTGAGVANVILDKTRAGERKSR